MSIQIKSYFLGYFNEIMNNIYYYYLSKYVSTFLKIKWFSVLQYQRLGYFAFKCVCVYLMLVFQFFW